MNQLKENINIGIFLKIGVLSLITALFAYLFLFFIGNFLSLYFAYDFDIGAWFNINGINFDQNKQRNLWTYDAEVTIFMGRPLLSLLIGIVSLSALILIRKLKIIFFFLLLWINIFAFNEAFGFFITDFILKNGLYYVASRMELGIEAMLFSLAILIFIMYRLGSLNAMLFVQYLPKKYKTGHYQKLKAVFISMIIPWLFTLSILMIVSYPYQFQSVHLKVLSTIVLLLPFLYSKKVKSKEWRAKLLKINNTDWLISAILLMVTVILYISMLSPISIQA